MDELIAQCLREMKNAQVSCALACSLVEGGQAEGEARPAPALAWDEEGQCFCADSEDLGKSHGLAILLIMDSLARKIRGLCEESGAAYAEVGPKLNLAACRIECAGPAGTVGEAQPCGESVAALLALSRARDARAPKWLSDYLASLDPFSKPAGIKLKT